MALSLTAKPAAIGLVALSPRIASAATTINVACSGAVGDVAGLKAAIVAANGAPGSTISLGACTYTLSAIDNGTGVDADGLPRVTGTVTIEGNGATVTRQSDAAFRIFDESSTANLTINHLTITNGLVQVPSLGGTPTSVGGAGIQNLGGKLTLNSATVSGNAATGTGGGLLTAKGGGIVSSGDTTINDSVITGNQAIAANNGQGSSNLALAGGGGIFAKGGTLKVHNTSITGNTAHASGGANQNSTGAMGGGIQLLGGFASSNGPAVQVSGSTVANNVATGTDSPTTLGAGGGMGQINLGSNSTTMTTRVVNSTFASNSALSNTSGDSEGGAIDMQGGPKDSFTLVNSTVADNTSQMGAVVHSGASDPSTAGTMTLTNTILATNPGGNCKGTVINGGHNISFPASAATCGSSFGHGNPVLGPLANNLGLTQTMALGTGSAAIDTADPAVCAAIQPAGAGSIDQRGLTRSEVGGDTTCDIGAFEVQAAAIIPGLPKAGLPAAPGDPTPGWLAVALAAGAAAAGLGAWRRDPED